MDDFVEELERMRREHEAEFGGQPLEYSEELQLQIVEYVRKQQRLKVPLAQLAARLHITYSTLKRWRYGGFTGRESAPRYDPTGRMRPVRISAKPVDVSDGKKERRFTIRSVRGWKVKDLTLAEITELLRSMK